MSNKYDLTNFRLRSSDRGPNSQFEAWVAGLVATDASIHGKKTPHSATLVLSQHLDDPTRMERIAEFYGKSLNPPTSRYGCKPIYTLRLPTVPLIWKTSVPSLTGEQEGYYVGGLLVGDGCLTSRKGKGLRIKFLWTIREEFLGKFFLDFLEKNSIGRGKIHRKTHNVREVWVRERDSEKLLEATARSAAW